MRSRSGVITTRWSIESVPFGWGRRLRGRGLRRARVEPVEVELALVADRPGRDSAARAVLSAAAPCRPRRRLTAHVEAGRSPGVGNGGDEELVDGRAACASRKAT